MAPNTMGDPMFRNMKLPPPCSNKRIGRHYLGWHPDRCRTCRRARSRSGQNRRRR